MRPVRTCFTHMLVEMSRCREKPDQACRAYRLLPAPLGHEVARGVVSDRLLLALTKPAETVRHCRWRKTCSCRVGGLLATLILVAGGELAAPPIRPPAAAPRPATGSPPGYAR